uniref:Nuclear RNA export factor 1 n=1 Tax=Leptobrachium leishanense TaxID=445787 RepID=A0A8C5WAR5_9ANUR
MCPVGIVKITGNKRGRAHTFPSGVVTRTQCGRGNRGKQIVVNAVPSKLPYSHMRTMHSVSVRSVTVSNMEGYLEEPRTSHIQRCLQKRYNGVRQSLDLSNFCNDPGLRSARIFLPLNKTSSIDLILQMLSEFCPQLLSLNLSCNNLIRLTGFAALYYTTPRLRSLNLSQNKLFLEQDLELIQNLDLRELWLEGNPIYASMMNSSAYYRSVLYHFPGVQKLDGKFFKPSFSFEIKATGALPPVKGSFCVSEEVKSFLTTFIHKFFTLYDSGRRQALLPLYHENAVCSFSLPNVRFPKICFDLLKDFQKENRNLMKVRKPDFRMQLLKYNKLQVVGFLCNLPKTKHDLQSLTLDVSLQTMTLLCFSLEGKFKEDVDSRDLIRAFRRTFIIVPAAESRAEILNDQMVVVNSYMRLKDPAPNALYGSSEGKPLTPERLDVVTAFSQQTGMKMEWALKCLSDNQWDLAQAGNMFTLLQNNGVIPQEAFTDAAPRNAAPRNAVL